MVELKGSLSSLGLPAIVQLIGDLQHSGNLELIKNESRGVLGFDDGRLVSASYGDQRGPQALAACTVELADADFLFVEGTPADERTMDLGGSELQTQLGRLVSGEIAAESLEPSPVKTEETLTLGICPLLGFVDDKTRHYSRPTAMHRCFATGAPTLVVAQEQRELCLSGRYPTCPRYRTASNPKSAAASNPKVAAPPPPAVAPPLVAASPPPAAVSRPTVPAGVAARMAANGQMRIAAPKSSDAVPDWIGQDHHTDPSDSPTVDARPAQFGLRFRRGFLLVAIGAGLGLAVVVVALLVTMPALNGGGLAQKPSNVVAQPVAPVSTVARASASVAQPTAASNLAPTLAPTATLAARPATPTVRVVPTAVPAAGQPLIDLRFASGPKPGWLDNPPYVAWSDGAYRFQARQATHFVAVSAPVDRPLGDVEASATFRKTGGPPGGGYGLVIRDQSPDPLNGINQDASFYVMETGDLGDIGVWRRDGDHWVDLVPWVHSASVRVGGSPNDLTVRAIGDQLTFIVNETEVASVQDNTLEAGGVGVFVGGDYNEVALDRFVVQVPD
jgi:Domain of unknown function (DUF4388)